MQCLRYSGITTRDNNPWSSKTCVCRFKQRTGRHVPLDSQAEGAKPSNLQVSCTGRLSQCNSSVWDNGQLLNTDSKFTFCRTQLILTIILFQGELQHRRVKRRYPRTSKTKATMVGSMTLLESRERYLQRLLDARVSERTAQDGHSNRTRRLRTSPSDHYHIAESSRKSQDITAWLSSLEGDPAIEVRRHSLLPEPVSNSGTTEFSSTSEGSLTRAYSWTCI